MRFRKTILALSIALVLCFSSYLSACTRGNTRGLPPDPAVIAVEELINLIHDGAITNENRNAFAEALVNAETAHADLTDAQKLRIKVEKAEKLVSSRSKLNTFDVNRVIALLNAIDIEGFIIPSELSDLPVDPSVRSTFEASVTTAENAYIALSTTLRAQVQSSASFARLGTAKEKLQQYDDAVIILCEIEALDNLVDPIRDEVNAENWVDFAIALDAAETYYEDILPTELKENAIVVLLFLEIEGARSRYNSFEDNFAIGLVLIDVNAVRDFPALSEENRGTFITRYNTANNAFNNLRDSLQGSVTDYASIMANAREKLASYDAGFVMGLIAVLPTSFEQVTDPETTASDILAAQNAYNARILNNELNDEAVMTTLVTNYANIEAARGLVQDFVSVQSVIDQINEIAIEVTAINTSIATSKANFSLNFI